MSLHYRILCFRPSFNSNFSYVPRNAYLLFVSILLEAFVLSLGVFSEKRAHHQYDTQYE